jgi:hypothetical protein
VLFLFCSHCTENVAASLRHVEHPLTDRHYTLSDNLESAFNGDVQCATSDRSERSRPIAIELPTIRKINTAPNYTPPEPLSARGDLPGYVN